MIAYSVILFLTIIPATASFHGSSLAATAATAPGACSATENGRNCSVSLQNNDHPNTLRDLQAYVALLEGKLEERLEKHEKQQWEQQRNLFVLLAVSICLAVVFIVALAACKVYVQSMQTQMQGSLQGEEQRGQQDCSARRLHTLSGIGAPKKPALPSDQAKLSSTDMDMPHQKDHGTSSRCSDGTHPATTDQFVFDDDLGDDHDLCVYPSREDVDRARAVEEVRAATGFSPELQQQQQQLEARCSRLFERLHEITDVSRAFCSSSSSDSEEDPATDPVEGETDGAQGKTATADAASGDTAKVGTGGGPHAQPRRQRKKRQRAADPVRIEEQRELLQQLQQLFHEIDAAFITNKPAHVSVMIRCCNALLRADGLAVLKACADCQPLHKEAQSIIEIVVPCIWAT